MMPIAEIEPHVSRPPTLANIVVNVITVALLRDGTRTPKLLQ